MQEHYDRLGLTPTATPEEIKAAYHLKLREFPAHTHPQEFKAIRAAYEVLRKGGKNLADEPVFIPENETAEFDPAQIARLRQQAIAQVEVTLEELMRLTF
ncbi:MAG: J domain-containing protein [Acaryochloridaceae cyanobacterium RU_4_10]|nr:J domain-containing protein [Acaryochloridaceae cyanobacterium RU_4_10]